MRNLSRCGFVSITLAVALLGLAGCEPLSDAQIVNKTGVRVFVSFQIERKIPLGGDSADGKRGSRTFVSQVFDVEHGDSGKPLGYVPEGCVIKQPKVAAARPDYPLKRAVRMGNKWCAKHGKAPKWILEYVPETKPKK